jgi:hypothetical protein
VRDKWIWILTVANLAIAFLLIAAIRATLYALGAFANYVFISPVLFLLFLGLALSLAGLRIARKTSSRVPRRLAFVVNGSTFAFHLIITLGIATILVRVQHRNVVIPAGYVGEVYIIHNVADGESPKRTLWSITYRIPPDGVLRSQAPINRGLMSTAYYYEHQDGTLQRIRFSWNTTIPRTAENLANNRDLGVFFPRTGKFQTSLQPCSVEFEQFDVGTKSYLLSGDHRKDLVKYLREHPVTCSDQNHPNRLSN